MKLQPNRFSSVQLSELTKNAFNYVTIGKNLKNKHARVMVLVHDTSSECAFTNVQSFVEISLRLSS